MSKIRLTLDPNGGVFEHGDQSEFEVTPGYTYGREAHLPVPFWDGYDFRGWFINSETGGEDILVNENTRIDQVRDHVLTAHWVRSVHGSLRTLMQLNSNEAAQLLKVGLNGRKFVRNGRWSKEGGYPDHTLTHRKDAPGIGTFVYDQATDSRWDETVGLYFVDSEMTLSGQNVWALSQLAGDIVDFMLKTHWKLKLLMDAAYCTRLPKFLITEPSGSVNHRNVKQYELNNSNREDPKTDNYYVAIPASDTPITEDNDLYYFDITDRSCKRASFLEDSVYYTRTGSGLYERVVAHKQGDLAGKNLYTVGPGGGYSSLGRVEGYEIVISGLTKPATMTVDGVTIPALYRAMAEGETIPVSARYVDRTNEDVGLVKDITNTLITRYRSIQKYLSVRHATVRAVSSVVPYTLEKLVKTINGVIDTIDPTVEHLNEDDFDVRDLKLKLNLLIDKIAEDDFFYKYILSDDAPESLRLDNIYDQLLEFMDDHKLIRSIATDCTVTMRSGRMTYLERQFEYDPTLPYLDVYDILNLKELDERNVNGNIKKSQVCDRYEVCTDEGWVPLQNVCNLRRIADMWSNRDYVVTMQVLSMMHQFMITPLLDDSSKIWLDALYNPKIAGSAARRAKLTACAEALEQFTNEWIVPIEEVLPIASMAVADIARHVNFFPMVSMDSAFLPMN